VLRAKREPVLNLKQSAFPHQVSAVEAVKGLKYAAIFHEQGLGKTKIALDLIVSWLSAGAIDSALVITKRGLIHNWMREIESHTFIRPAVLSQDKKSNYYLFNSPSRLYLAHYEVCKSEKKRLELFLKTRRVGVILDEAHKIKNPDTALTAALLALAPGFARRVIMTGTPVANRPFDIWAQIKFLDDGQSLGDDFASFRSDLDLSSELGNSLELRCLFEDKLADIYSRIESFSVRETKQSSGLFLPGKEIQSVRVPLSERQSELYRQFRDELRAVVERDGLPTIDQADEVLKRLMRLVQVASNPRLVDESYTEEPAKLPVLKTIVGTAIDGGSKIIVWTNFIDNAKWLARELRGFGSAQIHGAMSIEDRNASIMRFLNYADCRVLVATPGAAKEGLTLTVSNHAVFFDRSFSLDDYLQAQDRIHRISQGKTCYITNLISSDTVDEWVDDLLAAKHLAAQLAQGDIDRAAYQRAATYDFAETLKKVLRMTDHPAETADTL